MKHRSTGASRRSFLKTTGAAALAAGLFPMIVPSRAFGANSRLNIAVLGCGDRAGQILPSALRPGENVVALCDVNATRLARMKKDVEKDLQKDGLLESAKVYDDYRKLLAAEKGIDAVIVAAGQRWHTHMSKAALLAGKHVFCEKPLAHTCQEARDLRDLGKLHGAKLATQVGSQGGTSDTFRRVMEVIQAGIIGQVKESHAWINRSFPKSAKFDPNADPIPEGLNWDAWCGPSAVLPFKKSYLGGCLAWGRWLEFGDGHLADMGAHGLNLPWRALKLGHTTGCTVTVGEPVLDAYPSSTTFKWDFAAREGFAATTLFWHDGPKAGPPEEARQAVIAQFGPKSMGDGVVFIGEKGLIKTGAWGTGGMVKLNGEDKFRGVQEHAECKPVPVTLPRQKGQNHMQEWLDACKGITKTFQPFESAASIAEVAMVGMVALRLNKPIEWDGENLKVKNDPNADAWVRKAPRDKWL